MEDSYKHKKSVHLRRTLDFSGFFRGFLCFSNWKVCFMPYTELHSSIISNAVPYLSMGLISIYHFIERFEKKCSAKQICKILSVDQRSYSRWKNRHYIHERKKRKIELQQIITALFNENKKRYGYMRIAAELQKRGYKISSSTTARYMRELGLCVSIKKP